MSDSTAQQNCPSPVKRKNKSRKWFWTRRIVQALTFILFLYLVLRTQQSFTPFFHDLFFHLDPLAGIGAMIAAREIIPAMMWLIATLVVSLVFGRVWCSWVCPLGTVLDWTPAKKPGRKKLDIQPSWRFVKYFLLFAVLFSALLGILTLMILDPVTLMVRTLASVVLPGLGFLLTGFATLMYNVDMFQPAAGWLENSFRGTVITDQPFFLPNLVLAAVFAGVLALNAVRDRFWCRYLCPLGGLLALISRFSIVKHTCSESLCTSCHRCTLVCPTGAIDPKRKFAADRAECVTCLDCMETCPVGAISFKAETEKSMTPQLQASRRQFLSTVGLAVVGAAVIRSLSLFSRKPTGLIRPPGSDDDSLTDACIRCGECYRVCPTGAIQPSMSGSNPDGVWTPYLNMRTGYCSYGCNACGEVCPTGAIRKLALPQKNREIIGRAVIDRTRCIPWAQGTDCIVCEEMCPIPEKAIRLDARTVTGADGKKITVSLPRVRNKSCNGCGICEYQCPVDGVSAIRVFTGDVANGDD